jgi:hypothetical protein
VRLQICKSFQHVNLGKRIHRMGAQAGRRRRAALDSIAAKGQQSAKPLCAGSMYWPDALVGLLPPRRDGHRTETWMDLEHAMYLSADCHIMGPEDLFTRHLPEFGKFRAPIFGACPTGPRSPFPTAFLAQSPSNT